MKTPVTNGPWPIEKRRSLGRLFQIVGRKSEIARGFTLIELLVVISIIAILASLTFPILGALKRKEYISKTQAEMAELETAIDSYKATYGFYPPGSSSGPLTNQLYFELSGTTNINMSSGRFQTFDGGAKIDTATAQTVFGVNGFMNCSKPNGDETSAPAKDFLSNFKANQSATLLTNANTIAKILVASVGGPDNNYRPVGLSGVNPWRYLYPGVNNPSSYDLWVELKIGNKTNLVCNWSSRIDTSGQLP